MSEHHTSNLLAALEIHPRSPHTISAIHHTAIIENRYTCESPCIAQWWHHINASQTSATQMKGSSRHRALHSTRQKTRAAQREKFKCPVQRSTKQHDQQHREHTSNKSQKSTHVRLTSQTWSQALLQSCKTQNCKTRQFATTPMTLVS